MKQLIFIRNKIKMLRLNVQTPVGCITWFTRRKQILKVTKLSFVNM